MHGISDQSKRTTMPLAGLGILALLVVSISPARSQSDGSLLAQPSEQFNIYCDYNGGGTGECNRLDSNEPITCAFASQDFIQCRSRLGYLSICVYFAPGQFSCRKLSNVQLNPEGKCANPLDASSSCRPPLRERFTNPLNSLPSANNNSIKYNTLDKNLYDDLTDDIFAPN